MWPLTTLNTLAAHSYLRMATCSAHFGVSPAAVGAGPGEVPALRKDQRAVVVVCPAAGEALGRQMEALGTISAAAQQLGLPHLVIFAAEPVVRIGIHIAPQPPVTFPWCFDHSSVLDHPQQR